MNYRSGIDFSVEEYAFTSGVLDKIQQNRLAVQQWPLVYILSDGKRREAYVGETTNALQRLSAHRKHERKQKLTAVHLISSDRFHKSATLDIEANLIKYLAADGKYRLLNANLGIANHNYFQKREVYWKMFTALWSDLRNRGIARNSLEYIDNSDLFRYSPYKSLSEAQIDGLEQILRAIIREDVRDTFAIGGAGTGKTVLAIFLFKLLATDTAEIDTWEFGEREEDIVDLVVEIRELYGELKMGLVIPMSSFRSTVKRIFKGVGGLSPKMVIGPAEVANDYYDLLVVDEAHRLRKRTNLGAYFGTFDKASRSMGLDPDRHDELHWIRRQSEKAVFFYDAKQSIKPSDVDPKRFQALRTHSDSNEFNLDSQFRVRGGNGYVAFVHRLLHVNLPTGSIFRSANYECYLFTDLRNLVTILRKREAEFGLSRLIAGYAWPWRSNKPQEHKNYRAFDIEIDGLRLKWNSTNNDWINSANAREEVGCIHTTQGYDLNYAGVIFGPEIGFDPETERILVYPERYFDRNGKASIDDPEVLKQYIVNIYQTILLRGIKGTFIYACDVQLRKHFARHLPMK